MKQADHTKKSRTPRGIVSKNPVPLRLSTDEKAELEILATRESRTRSSMARLVYLRGVEAIAAEQKG
ncbi:hypothetical protein AAH678_14980 [Sodalis endosymbiont of Spalangia cameroni]|uniref:hypothetical protein n=1 Tax=Sodalis praecaptivus TaxID=1239307 RepID=UPI0031F85D6E